MYLEIITPEKKLFSGETELVKLPGTEGSFEVLMNHAPAISTLAEGKIKGEKRPTDHISFFEIKGSGGNKNNNIIVVLLILQEWLNPNLINNLKSKG